MISSRVGSGIRGVTKFEAVGATGCELQADTIPIMDKSSNLVRVLTRLEY